MARQLSLFDSVAEPVKAAPPIRKPNPVEDWYYSRECIEYVKAYQRWAKRQWRYEHQWDIHARPALRYIQQHGHL